MSNFINKSKLLFFKIKKFLILLCYSLCSCFKRKREFDISIIDNENDIEMGLIYYIFGTFIIFLCLF